jgi:FkbH-like protein
MNLSELIKENAALGAQLAFETKIELKVLANITINQIKPCLEYQLRLEGLNATVNIGEYDNILQDSTKINENEIPIIFWEPSNIKDSFIYEIEVGEDDFVLLYVNKIKGELNTLFNNLSEKKLVIFNKFSHILQSYTDIKKSRYQVFVEILNKHIEENLPRNFIYIEIDKVISKISCQKAIDLRGFYLNKSLYTVEFLNTYSKYILPIILSLYGKSKKALILDCDNTLWKGIIGEDGVNNIALSDKDKWGIYFKELHFLAKKLSKAGVILGICSKNNPQDVDEVFNFRKDSILQDSDIVIKRVNWEDKATNLKNIAKELNIGIESIVFIDDSIFETNLINDLLPQIKTLLVPERLYEYPNFVKANTNLFFNLNVSDEDKRRTSMYKANQLRERDLKSFESIETYLMSLDLTIELSNKKESALERLVQLTQKTNQFNLTTKRYSSSDLKIFYNSTDVDVFSLDVSDKYGSSGITGLCIVRYSESVAIIDTFLLSCRVLGRNIEKAFLSEIISQIRNKNVESIKLTYIKTSKNSQVENFFDQNGFLMTNENQNLKEYEYNFLNNVTIIKYINVIWTQD